MKHIYTYMKHIYTYINEISHLESFTKIIDFFLPELGILEKINLGKQTAIFTHYLEESTCIMRMKTTQKIKGPRNREMQSKMHYLGFLD